MLRGGLSTDYSTCEPDLEGELIVYAGSTAAAESSEEGYIHFSMKRDDKYINPSDELTK